MLRRQAIEPESLVVLKTVSAWALFAAVHSATITDRWNSALRRVLGADRHAALHRLIYTAISVVTFGLLIAWLLALPDRPLYAVGWPARGLFRALQLCGIAVLLRTPLKVSEFVGLRQALASHDGNGSGPEPPPRLYTGRTYRLVRHPLYLGCSLVLAFRPDQTVVSAASTAAAILYFYLGTFHEEARLLATFGDAYRAYRREVPRLFPIPFRRK